jgi:predicted RNA-binding Zn-ribbon protein involved in translation (DUF1610 family)
MAAELVTCSTCNTEFDYEAEGGLLGDFGMIPVAFCPTCKASCWEMWTEMRECSDCYPCPKCGYEGDV